MSSPDPRNPSVLDARELDAARPTTHIVYYRADHGDWVMERTSDKAVVESGPLEDMLALIGTTYPNARRATWAEDTLRWRPSCLQMTEEEERVFATLDAIARAKRF